MCFLLNSMDLSHLPWYSRSHTISKCFSIFVRYRQRWSYSRIYTILKQHKIINHSRVSGEKKNFILDDIQTPRKIYDYMLKLWQQNIFFYFLCKIELFFFFTLFRCCCFYQKIQLVYKRRRRRGLTLSRLMRELNYIAQVIAHKFNVASRE